MKAQAWAWEQKAGSPNTKLVLMALADHANDDGVCWPGQTRLAAKAEMTTRAVRANLDRLVKSGLVRAEERRRGNGTRTSNLYFLVFDQPEDSSGGQPVNRKPASGGGQPEANDTSHRKPASGHELSEEPSGIGGTRAGARVKISGKPVKAESWEVTAQILVEFNRQTGRDLRLLTSGGQASEAAKRIYGRVAAYPDIGIERHSEIIANTLASMWWGDGRGSIGVVYGPKVFEDNIARKATPTGKRAKAAAKAERQRRSHEALDALGLRFDDDDDDVIEGTAHEES